MTMLGGSVTVAGDGTASGTGLAKALYDAHLATLSLLDPASPPPGFAAADVNAANLAIKQSVAQMATAYGPAIITYIATNGHAHIAADASMDGLQNGTTHPAAPKDIPLV